jgi:glycosyltransferase involved in cell wall biosynthesis
MPDRILVFVPAYNCERQIGRVLDQLEEPWVSEFIQRVIVVDNRSTDGTESNVRRRIASRGDGFIELLKNVENYGLGGSHKVAFDYAKAAGFDWLVVLHGDDQGCLSDFRSHLAARTYSKIDCLLGSRFMRGAKAPGYSRFRIFGNQVFNGIYSVCVGASVRDLGAGLNMYRTSALDPAQYYRHPDNLTFNCVLLCSQVISGLQIRFVPISWREDDQVSNVKLVRQSLETLRIALKALYMRSRFLTLEHRQVIRSGYPSTVVDARS